MGIKIARIFQVGNTFFLCLENMLRPKDVMHGTWLADSLRLLNVRKLKFKSYKPIYKIVCSRKSTQSLSLC